MSEEFTLGERAGRSTVKKDDKDRACISIYYGREQKHADQQINLYPEEMDNLVEWWQEQRGKHSTDNVSGRLPE